MNKPDLNSDPPTKKRGSRWRFSIRSALILTTIAAVAIMFYQRRSRATQIASELQELGAYVEFHPAFSPWLSKYTGDLFRDVRVVRFGWFGSDEAIANLDDLPYLEVLSLASGDYANADFGDFKAQAELSPAGISVEGFERIAKCKELRELSIRGCVGLDDRCVEVIKKLPKLETLDVTDTNLTAKGIADLAAIPSLRQLTFAGVVPKSWTGTPVWFSGDQIRSIDRRTELTVTLNSSEFYFDNADDEALVWLENSTSRITKVHVRNSELSSVGIRAISNLPELGKLRFENCPLQLEDIEMLDPSETSIVLKQTTLNVNDLIRQFGAKFHTVNFGTADTAFFTGGADAEFRLRIEDVADELDEDIFESMPNLKHINSFCPKDQSLFKALRKTQPSINLYCLFRGSEAKDTFWDTIKETPSLTGLDVHRAPEGSVPQFTPYHRLKRLRVYRVPDDADFISEELFQEIAKLKHLRALTIRNRPKIGKEILPLAKLKNLRTVDLGPVDEAAAKILLDMNLDDLEVSWDLLSPETIKRIRRLR